VAFVATKADTSAASKAAGSYFYVYSESGSRVNHFIPSGWMGDYGDLKVDQGWKDNPAEGQTCIKVSYSGKRAQGAGWAGVYWQQPSSNWGNKAGGYDLSKYHKVTFWARGGAGGEKIGEFKVGGISGQAEKGDSDAATTGPVTLTSDWKKYTIDLSGKDMSYIIGGFCFAANADDNPKGFDLYLDEIRYE
jgi:hypothetical protein